jgi:hypothetical protein
MAAALLKDWAEISKIPSSSAPLRRIYLRPTNRDPGLPPMLRPVLVEDAKKTRRTGNTVR